MTQPLAHDAQSFIDRALDIGGDLAARCRVIDPDQTLGWSHLSLELLNTLNQFAVREGGLSLQAGVPLSAYARTFLQQFSLSMMLLEALCEHAESAQPHTSALPADIADIIAHLLVDVGMLSQTAYQAHRQGIPVERYVREAIKASGYMGPMGEAFTAAMKGDQDAAAEAQRLLHAFMAAAAEGRVMPPPWEIDGEGQS